MLLACFFSFALSWFNLVWFSPDAALDGSGHDALPVRGVSLSVPENWDREVAARDSGDDVRFDRGHAGHVAAELERGHVVLSNDCAVDDDRRWVVRGAYPLLVGFVVLCSVVFCLYDKCRTMYDISYIAHCNTKVLLDSERTMPHCHLSARLLT